MGFMQLMFLIVSEFGVMDLWDLEQNVCGGMCYFCQMFDQFGGKVDFVLVGYNVGFGVVQCYGGVLFYCEIVGYVDKVFCLMDGCGWKGRVGQVCLQCLCWFWLVQVCCDGNNQILFVIN